MNSTKSFDSIAISKIEAFLKSLKCDNFFYKSVTNTSYPFSHVFITTCLSARHVQACADDLEKFIKENKDLMVFNKQQNSNSIISMDGSSDNGWIAFEIKTINAIIHFFTKETRLTYNIEDHINKVSASR